MAKPKETLWAIDAHTLAKHFILRRYLSAWLPIMSLATARRSRDRKGRLVLVDGFAGPGRYLGDELGSPLLMLDVFLGHSQRQLIKSEIVCLFIEQDDERAKHLQGEVDALRLSQQAGDQLKVEVILGAFDEVFAAALDSVGGNLAPTFAFIDPFGYSQAPMTLTGRFLLFERCEALIYMPLPWVARFVGRAGQEAALNSLFGGDAWRPAIELKGDDRVRFLHDLFRDQLMKEGGVKYVRSFDIPTAKGNGYTLFFGTNHLLGLERMVEVMWATDPIEGRRFRDTTDQDHPVLFDPGVDIAPLLAAMKSHFGSREFSIEEAQEFTLTETLFAPSHIKRKTLAPLEKSDGLQVTESKRKKRFAYPEGTRMRFV